MKNKQHRQFTLLCLLREQGTGVVSLPDSSLSTLLGVSKKTIQRDLKEMNGKGIIIKETKLINKDGVTKTQRDIVVPDEPQRRFTLSQHNNLSSIDNHKVFTTNWGEVIWMRRPGGEGTDWERHCPSKEFRDEKQVYKWIYSNLYNHKKKYIEGDRYTKR